MQEKHLSAPPTICESSQLDDKAQLYVRRGLATRHVHQRHQLHCWKSWLLYLRCNQRCNQRCNLCELAKLKRSKHHKGCAAKGHKRNPSASRLGSLLFWMKSGRHSSAHSPHFHQRFKCCGCDMSTITGHAEHHTKAASMDVFLVQEMTKK